MNPKREKAAVGAAANPKIAFDGKQHKNSIIRFPLQRHWSGPRQRMVAEYLAARRPPAPYRIPLSEDLIGGAP